MHSENVRQYYLDSLLPSILTSVQSVSTYQHNRQLLAEVAAYSINAALYIIQTLTKALHGALVTDSDYVSAKSIATCISFLFEQENRYAAQAYQDLSPPNITSFGILSALIPTKAEQGGNIEAIDIKSHLLKHQHFPVVF